MILKPNFELVDIADEHMLVAVGKEAESFGGVVTLTEAAAFILNNLHTNRTKDELLKLLLEEYEVEESEALTDLEELISSLIEMGIIEEC